MIAGEPYADTLEYAPDQLHKGVERMSEGSEFPPLEFILENWISTAEAAVILGTDPNNPGNVRRLCIEGKLRARRVGGQWYIDPESAKAYVPYSRGRPYPRPEDKED